MCCAPPSPLPSRVVVVVVANQRGRDDGTRLSLSGTSYPCCSLCVFPSLFAVRNTSHLFTSALFAGVTRHAVTPRTERDGWHTGREGHLRARVGVRACARSLTCVLSHMLALLPRYSAREPPSPAPPFSAADLCFLRARALAISSRPPWYLLLWFLPSPLHWLACVRELMRPMRRLSAGVKSDDDKHPASRQHYQSYTVLA